MAVLFVQGSTYSTDLWSLGHLRSGLTGRSNSTVKYRTVIGANAYEPLPDELQEIGDSSIAITLSPVFVVRSLYHTSSGNIRP